MKSFKKKPTRFLIVNELRVNLSQCIHMFRLNFNEDVSHGGYEGWRVRLIRFSTIMTDTRNNWCMKYVASSWQHLE